MSIRLTSNIAALNVQRRLGESTSQLSQAYARLSTGLRINRAQDDAAGLAISAALDVDARVLNQGARNISDGISYLNIADGAVSELSGILVRLSELATQASNGIFTNEQRSALNSEAQALQAEYNRIVRSTTFNGSRVFGEQTDVRVSNSITIQAGYGALGTLTAGTEIVDRQLVGNGTFRAETSFTVNQQATVSAADYDGDGILDMVSTDATDNRLSFFHGNGDGTFRARVTYAFSTQYGRDIAEADVNGDGALDIVGFAVSGVNVVLGNGNGTFKAATTFQLGAMYPTQHSIRLFDSNNDGHLDILAAFEAGAVFDFAIIYGNGDGTFRTGYTFDHSDNGIALGDLNGDGITDIVSFENNPGTPLQIMLGNGNGSFQGQVNVGGAFAAGSRGGEVADINRDGILDIITGTDGVGVLLGNGNGTFKLRTISSYSITLDGLHLADLNRDGFLDAIGNQGTAGVNVVFMGNGDGTFNAGISYAGGGGTAESTVLADFNNDNVLDILHAPNPTGTTLGILLGNGDQTTTYTGISEISGISLATLSAARDAQGAVAAIRTSVNGIRGAIGASMSRFDSALSTLQTTSTEATSARSRIVDADIAEEAARLVRSRILQNVGASLLAQANLQPALALRLLTGE